VIHHIRRGGGLTLVNLSFAGFTFALAHELGDSQNSHASQSRQDADDNQ
jgi:hypothetical protein